MRLLFAGLGTQHTAAHTAGETDQEKLPFLTALSCGFGELIFKYSLLLFIFNSYKACGWIIQMQQVQRECSIQTWREKTSCQKDTTLQDTQSKNPSCTLHTVGKATYSLNSIFTRS